MSVTKYLPNGTSVTMTDAEFAAQLAARFPPPPPFEVSKLKLRRELRTLGLESDYDTFLGSMPTSAQKEYAESVYLNTGDEAFISALTQFAAFNGKTEAELRAILIKARA